MCSLLAYSQIPKVKAGPKCSGVVWLTKSPGHHCVYCGKKTHSHIYNYIFKSEPSAGSFIGVNQTSSRSHCLSFWKWFFKLVKTATYNKLTKSYKYAKRANWSLLGISYFKGEAQLLFVIMRRVTTILSRVPCSLEYESQFPRDCWGLRWVSGGRKEFSSRAFFSL